MTANDYYETLGVARGATEKEIRSAYRRLAREHHPDVNQGDKGAEARFKRINEAYQTLSNPDSRKKYDRFGADWRHAGQFPGGPGGDGQFRGGHGAGGQFHGGHGAGAQFHGGHGADGQFRGGHGVGGQFHGGHGAGAPPFTFFRNARTGGAGPRVEFDIGEFGGAFEDFWSGARGKGRGARSQTAPDAPATITLEEAYAGASRVVLAPDGKRLEVRVPPGVKSGERVRVEPEGGALDLLVTVAPHAVFERAGDDLRYAARVPMLDAVLGGEAAVPTIEGKSVAVRIPPGTQNGRVIRLRGKGMPKRGGGYGDLLVAVNAVLPTELTDEQRALFERLREAERGAAAAG